jgi:hypothetical protein
MPADGGLGQLHDRAKLVDGELVPFESEKKPAPRRVGEGGHLPEKGGRLQSVNPFIRIEGYNGAPRKSSVWTCQENPNFRR